MNQSNMRFRNAQCAVRPRMVPMRCSLVGTQAGVPPRMAVPLRAALAVTGTELDGFSVVNLLPPSLVACIHCHHSDTSNSWSLQFVHPISVSFCASNLMAGLCK